MGSPDWRFAVAFVSVREFMEDSPVPTAGARAVLEVRGLRRHFGKVPAVDGIDLTVREGEIYGFLGINGAGKTTTIRALMGIIAAESGAITILDETTRRTSVAQKQRIG